MLPFLLIAVLVLGAVLVYLPLSERRIRDLGVVVMTISSGIAVYIAWPGFAAAQAFGPSQMWYLDGLAALMLVLIAAISLSSAIIAHRYLAREHEEGIISLTDIRHYSTMVPLFVASMYVATLSNNVGLLWVAIEATTLSTTLLVAFYRKQSAIEAAWKYVLLCSLGISLGLVGVLLTTYAAGQNGVNSSLLLTTFRDIATAGGVNAGLIKWAFVFLFVGIGTKVGFVPMHTWLPDAHSKTPSPVSALLSGILLNVALVALLRFRQVTDLALGDGGSWTGKFFLVFGVMSILLPAFILLIQKNYKRLLAYSSIEHMGLMAFAIGLGPAGIIPAIMHMPAHALLKSGLFFGAGEIFITYKTTDSSVVTHVWSRLPKTATLFLFTLLMLLAVPPGAVFVSELIMIGFGLHNFLIPTLIVIVALTMVFVAMLRHVYAMLMTSGAESEVSTPVHAKEAWGALHVVMIVHLLAAVTLGIYYLTPEGLETMVRIAQSLNSGLL
ncbi:MAG TPA: proton-conducting transporter membrane subunit [bacterium]|nr:proton-conducting transporter membrane subunit [bacterium]